MRILIHLHNRVKNFKAEFVFKAPKSNTEFTGDFLLIYFRKMAEHDSNNPSHEYLFVYKLFINFQRICLQRKE